MLLSAILSMLRHRVEKIHKPWPMMCDKVGRVFVGWQSVCIQKTENRYIGKQNSPQPYALWTHAGALREGIGGRDIR